MNRQTIALIAILTALLGTACAGTSTEPLDTPDPPPADTPSTPVDAEPVRGGTAQVDDLQLLVLESFPVQVRAVIQGTVPDSCTAVGPIVEFIPEQDLFKINMVTERPPDAICATVIEPYEESVSLPVEGLPAGTYAVTAGGKKATFELTQDNVALPVDDDDDEPQSVLYLNTLDLSVLESFPVQVNALISGDLPNGCTSIANIKQQVDPNNKTIDVMLYTSEPDEDVACTEALVPFEEIVSLNVRGLPAGTYTVTVNEQLQGEFTLETDNSIEEDMESDPALRPGTSYVNTLTIEGAAPALTAVVNGSFPNACYSLTGVSQQVMPDQNRIALTLDVASPGPDVMCAQVITPFTERVPLDVEGLEAGRYTVTLGEEFRAVFNLD